MKTPKFVERLDPRTKFAAVLFLTLAVLAVGALPMLLIPAAVLILATLCSEVPWKHIARRARTVVWFGILIIGLHGMSETGQVLFHAGGIYVTREGIQTGAGLTARLLLLVWASTVFVRTTPIGQLVDSLDTTLHGFGRSTRSLGLVTGIAIGFAPMLVHTAQRLKRAQQSRGVDVDSGLARKLRFALSAALPLFALTYRSSEQLALAMDARGFDPSVRRSLFHDLELKAADRWVLAGLGALVVALLAL